MSSLQYKGEKVFLLFVYVVLIFSMAITLYPFIYVVSMSISNPTNVIQQSIVLLPKGFSLKSYELILKNSEVWRAYGNTIWIAFVGTIINVFLTIVTAYPLSRRGFVLKKFFMVFIVITMFFGGGMIPTFLLIKNLHLYNTRWAIILPAAISTWYVIITMTYIRSSISDAIQESARIEGCNDIQILFRIIFPLSLPIMAVVGLYNAVGFWNTYFSALLYLPSPELQPLQLFLMKVLVQNKSMTGNLGGYTQVLYAAQLKYSVIIVSILPIICVYPFLQKYFIKGVMIGAIKE